MRTDRGNTYHFDFHVHSHAGCTHHASSMRHGGAMHPRNRSDSNTDGFSNTCLPCRLEAIGAHTKSMNRHTSGGQSTLAISLRPPPNLHYRRPPLQACVPASRSSNMSRGSTQTCNGTLNADCFKPRPIHVQLAQESRHFSQRFAGRGLR